MVWSLTQHCLIKFVWYSLFTDYGRPEWQANISITWAQTNCLGSKWMKFLKANRLLISEYAGIILMLLPLPVCCATISVLNIYLLLKSVTFWYLIYICVYIYIYIYIRNMYTEYIFKKTSGYSPMFLTWLIIKLQNLILAVFANKEEEIRTRINPPGVVCCGVLVQTVLAPTNK